MKTPPPGRGDRRDPVAHVGDLIPDLSLSNGYDTILAIHAPQPPRRWGRLDERGYVTSLDGEYVGAGCTVVEHATGEEVVVGG